MLTDAAGGFQYETADAVQLDQRACSHVFRRHIYPKEMPKKPAVVYLLAGADSQGRRLEAGKNYRVACAERHASEPVLGVDTETAQNRIKRFSTVIVLSPR